MPVKGWRKRQIMQWVPSEKKEQPEEGDYIEVTARWGKRFVEMLDPIKGNGDIARFYFDPPQPEQESKLKRFVWFKTANGWRKEEFEKTLVKKVPLDNTPPKPHVWFDFSNCDRYSSKEEFEKTLLNNVPQREWVGLDDEDMKELRDADFDLLYGARWAERKLREKNGG
jgi:hypothetical protein